MLATLSFASAASHGCRGNTGKCCNNAVFHNKLVYRLANNGDVVAFKMGSARREEGAYLNRYVTDEQRGRQPIFNATLRAGASWVLFRVARSTRRMTQIWALPSRLEKQPTDLRRRHHYLRDGTLGRAH